MVELTAAFCLGIGVGAIITFGITYDRAFESGVQWACSRMGISRD